MQPELQEFAIEEKMSRCYSLFAVFFLLTLSYGCTPTPQANDCCVSSMIENRIDEQVHWQQGCCLNEEIDCFIQPHRNQGNMMPGQSMDLPSNLSPMGNPGPFGVIEFGGMFTILKVREGSRIIMIQVGINTLLEQLQK